jgi:hypothetical protein
MMLTTNKYKHLQNISDKSSSDFNYQHYQLTTVTIQTLLISINLGIHFKNKKQYQDMFRRMTHSNFAH